jgi:hypothetical protein
MAAYNLACACAGAGQLDSATAALRAALTLNPDLRANAARDPDLADVHGSARLGTPGCAPTNRPVASATARVEQT